MAEKAAVNADIPNDDVEILSSEEQAAFDDRSTIGATRRAEDAELIAAEAKAEPEAKPAAKAEEAKPEVKTEEQKQAGHVPIASLIEERKEWQARLKEEAEKRAQLEGKFNLITERLNKPAEQPKPINVDDNPLEALKQTRQQLEQVTNVQQQQAVRHQFATHVAAQVNAYKANTPDYDDAYKFARNSTISELKARGFTETDIPQVLENGEFQLATEALQRGKNVAQHLYDFAVARGYKKAEPQAEVKTEAKPTAQERIETAAKGQANSKSLSSGGSAPAAKLTLVDLESMSEDDIADMPEEKFRALFG